MTIRAFAVLSLVLLFSFAAPAQFTESIEVRVVNIDVTVTDRDGNPMTGLGRGDFRLDVDGKPTEISHFSSVSRGSVDLAEAAPAEAEPAAPAPNSSVTWAVFFDRRDLRPSLRAHALRNVAAFLELSMQEGDRGMLVTFNGDGFRVRGDGLSDRATLTKLLAAVEKEKVNAGFGAIDNITIRRTISEAEKTKEEAGITAEHVKNLMAAEAHRSRNAMMAVGGFLDVLTGAEGRVALLYVGPGFFTLPALNVNASWHTHFAAWSQEQWAPRPQEHRPSLEDARDRLYARMSASRVALYTIHTGEEGRGPAEVTAEGQQDEHAMGISRELAERTGGHLLKGSVAVDRQLATVRSELSHYYSLAYVSHTSAPQKVKVSVNVPGARVRHRTRVHQRTRDEEAGDAVVSALFNDRETNRFGITVEPGTLKPAKRNQPKLLPLRVKVPLDALTFLPDGNVQRAGVTFHFALASDDGSIWRLDSRELPLAIPQKDFAKALRQSITYDVEVPMHAATMRISVSVQDKIGQVRSVVVVER